MQQMNTHDKANILVIDDNLANLRLLTQMLSHKGYKVCVADDGLRALEAVSANPPDLILLDVMMPGMDGYQVCEQLKANEATRDIPVIFLSALGATDDKVKAFTVGGVDYITKPFQNPEVIARVQVHLKLQALTQELMEALSQREWLVRDTYHRVKNNLMVVESLLRFQESEIADPIARDKFKESRTRVRSMLLIHEKLHQSQNLTQVDFAAYLRKLAVDLFHAYKPPTFPVEMLVEVQDAFLSADTATSCGLIVNELISNALKHAFKEREQGRLSVTLRQEQDQYVLTISDNGIGIPEDFDFQNATSLGMRIVTMKVHDLAGGIELDRRGGTTWKVTFTERLET